MMTNQEILKVLENLEGFKYKNVYTEEQIEKDRNSLNKLKEQLRIGGVVKSLPTKEEINLAANKCSDVNGIICEDEYWIIAKNDGFKEGVEWLINRLK